jgi:hypothetical protein
MKNIRVKVFNCKVFSLLPIEYLIQVILLNDLNLCFFGRLAQKGLFIKFYNAPAKGHLNNFWKISVLAFVL